MCGYPVSDAAGISAQVSLIPKCIHFVLYTEFPVKGMDLVKNGRRDSCHEPTGLFIYLNFFS